MLYSESKSKWGMVREEENINVCINVIFSFFPSLNIALLEWKMQIFHLVSWKMLAVLKDAANYFLLCFCHIFFSLTKEKLSHLPRRKQKKAHAHKIYRVYKCARQRYYHYTFHSSSSLLFLYWGGRNVHKNDWKWRNMYEIVKPLLSKYKFTYMWWLQRISHLITVVTELRESHAIKRK